MTCLRKRSNPACSSFLPPLPSQHTDNQQRPGQSHRKMEMSCFLVYFLYIKRLPGLLREMFKNWDIPTYFLMILYVPFFACVDIPFRTCPNCGTELEQSPERRRNDGAAADRCRCKMRIMYYDLDSSQYCPAAPVFHFMVMLHEWPRSVCDRQRRRGLNMAPQSRSHFFKIVTLP